MAHGRRVAGVPPLRRCRTARRLCPLIEEVLDNADEHTLFMGPGLLAGGTIGKEKGPQHFTYLLEAFSVCEEH